MGQNSSLSCQDGQGFVLISLRARFETIRDTVSISTRRILVDLRCSPVYPPAAPPFEKCQEPAVLRGAFPAVLCRSPRVGCGFLPGHQGTEGRAVRRGVGEFPSENGSFPQSLRQSSEFHVRCAIHWFRDQELRRPMSAGVMRRFVIGGVLGRRVFRGDVAAGGLAGRILPLVGSRILVLSPYAEYREPGRK